MVSPISSSLFEQAVLEVRVDLESDHAAVGPADFLLLEIEVSVALAPRSASSNSFSRSSGDTLIGNMPFLKQLL